MLLVAKKHYLGKYFIFLEVQNDLCFICKIDIKYHHLFENFVWWKLNISFFKCDFCQYNFHTLEMKFWLGLHHKNLWTYILGKHHQYTKNYTISVFCSNQYKFGESVSNFYCDSNSRSSLKCKKMWNPHWKASTQLVGL